MKTVCVFLLLGIGAVNAGDWSSATSSTSPVAKVIELLDTLKGKIEADVQKEAGLMEEFSGFCDTELKDIAYAISTAKGQIEDFNAAIEDAEAQISGLGDEVKALSSTIAEKESEVAEAKTVRAAGNKDFQANERELIHTIDELARSLVAAKKQVSLLQVKGKTASPQQVLKAIVPALEKIMEATWLPTGSKDSLKAFIQQGADASEDNELSMAQPQGTATNYESHSGGITDTLSDMEEKAQGQLGDLRKAEMEAQFSYQMLDQGLLDEIKLLKTKMGDATAGKAQNQEVLGKTKGELSYTSKTLAQDEARLLGQTQECDSKASEWAERQKSAGEETSVIAKAKEILSSGVKAFVQLRSRSVALRKVAAKNAEDDDDDAEEDLREQLADKLKGLGRKFHSYALTQLVSSARADPFGKIRGLVGDMVEKLMSEAAEEADAKAFCDEENAKARKSQKDKTMDLDKFSARIDEASSAKAELEEAVRTLQGELAEIDKNNAEATKLRAEEHNAYLKASKDWKDSADAVAAAVSVLHSYYEGAFLIQVSSAKKQPGMGISQGPGFGGSGKESGDSAHTIIEVLQIAEEDFTKLLAESDAAEEADAAAYKKASDSAGLAKAAKGQEVKDKQSEAKSLEVALTHHSEDRTTVSKELDAVIAYLDKLKPQCENKAMSYEEKKARRESEIDGLKEAMAIIEGKGVAVSLVQRKRSLRAVRAA